MDLMLIADLCHHFHAQYLLLQPQQCLGYLPCRGHHLQRFYRLPPDRHFTGSPLSLHAIIAWINTHSFQGCLPLPAAFHMAGSLAASVLQFHSTPWLPETWRSQDIRFFSVGGKLLSPEDELRLSDPYFKADFAKRGKGKGKAVNQTATCMLAGQGVHVGARNELLFPFGIVLLEIGFSRSWQALRDRVCAECKLPLARQTGYHIAEKLCAMLTNQMGPKYPRIIRKCIGCDFGLQDPQNDLARSEELQTGFLVDVVVELQRMKDGVRVLGSTG
jgi:hypothetical protein